MRPLFQARLTRGLFTLALGATLLVSLQACVPLMVGSTVASAIVATDRRTVGAQTDDAAMVTSPCPAAYAPTKPPTA